MDAASDNSDLDRYPPRTIARRQLNVNGDDNKKRPTIR